MKGKHNESLSLRLFNNGKDVKMEKENKGVSHTSFEVQRKKKKYCLSMINHAMLYCNRLFRDYWY